MATIKIGNRNTAFQPAEADTTYLLAEGKTISSATSGIYQPASLADMTFDIRGRIEAVEHGIRIGDDMSPVSGLDIRIDETGRIDSVLRAIDIHGSGQRVINAGELLGSDGVRSSGGDGVIINTGIIDATTAGIVAGGPHRIVNSGSIAGDLYGIALNATESGSGVVRNSGTVEGANAAIRGSLFDDRIVNSGTLKGDVFLASGNDFFAFKAGTVTGEIEGGHGDDRYLLNVEGAVILENFGQGFDLVRSSVSFTVGSYIEQVNLIGNGDIDATGNDQANHLQGNAGRNVLRGEAGSDFLVGLTGNDTLFGGAGDDVFNFQRGSGKDTVMDFEAGIDEIQLGGLKGASDFADMVANHVESKGADIWITYGTDIVILKDTTAGELMSTDFSYATPPSFG
jgi:Ca2+-binding RTX toxin-like protein